MIGGTARMLLAEALSERKVALGRHSAITGEISSVAVVEEGTEGASAAIEKLLDEADSVAQRITTLTVAINRTNSSTEVEAGKFGSISIMEGIALRDELKLRHKQAERTVSSLTSTSNWSYGRKKDDVVYIAAFSVETARATVAQLAQDIRDLDIAIQKANWSVELS